MRVEGASYFSIPTGLGHGVKKQKQSTGLLGSLTSSGTYRGQLPPNGDGH